MLRQAFRSARYIRTATVASAAPRIPCAAMRPTIWQAVEKGVGPKELERLIYVLGGSVNVCKPLTGETPVELAIKRQSPPLIVRLLLHAGAHISKRVDKDGSSLLHLAAEKSSDPKVIEMLMRAGLKPSHRNFRLETPVHVAARLNGNPKILETLLSRDPKLDLVLTVNEMGQCPLDVAHSHNVFGILERKGGASGLSTYDWSPIFPQSRFRWGSSLE